MDESETAEKPFCVERAKQGRAACKNCKEKCLKDELRLGKYITSSFGLSKFWYHVDCLFEVFMKQRPTTKRLVSSGDLEGWENLSKPDREVIIKKVEECEKAFTEKCGKDFEGIDFETTNNGEASTSILGDESSKDNNKFKEFRRLVANIANESSYTEKTAFVAKMFKSDNFNGNIVTWCKMLLPDVNPRIYNLQNKQLIKLFSRLFCEDVPEMLTHLEQGDIGDTIEHFFKESVKVTPSKKTNLTISEVDDFLEGLSKLTKEDEQVGHFREFLPSCTAGDLKYVVRLIKHDLRMGAGPKHILEGVHADAYTAFLSCRDIALVIKNCLGKKETVPQGIVIMKPVKPMLAEACKSIEQAMKKCPNGMYSEIKYDGERVQVHKKDNEFKYFTRNLKPVLQHKIKYFKTHIPEAFPLGEDLILDCEVLMVDNNTGAPLPFGTLGVHKKNDLQDASVCLFVFDCIYFNGQDLTDRPLRERREILHKNMTEITNVIKFSEMKEIYAPADLAGMITDVLKMGLEGLVLKDIESKYEPGKRHWLKVKKDYLFDGAMADSADLIVLGAWYGTGRKGGLMSVFLMGIYDVKTKKFCTVTKVHTGHDDKTLDRLQSELDMVKISGDVDKVPSWLRCTRTMVPDFVAKDPKKQPVWEITGAEFTQQHDVHTANGISIRFPRVTKIRNDKDWESATTLLELTALYKSSKHNFDGSLFDKELEGLQSVSPKKRKPESPKIDEFLKRNKGDSPSKSDDSAASSSSKARKDDSSSSSMNNFSTMKPKATCPSDKHNEDSNDFLPNNSSSKKRKQDCLDNSLTKKIKATSSKYTEDSIDDFSTKKRSSSNCDDTKPKKTKKSRVQVEIDNPLPNFFGNIQLALENEDLRLRFKHILRLFVAFGGTILSGRKMGRANFILHEVTSVSKQCSDHPKSGKHVSTDWLKHCIEKRKLINESPYLVKLIPDS